MPAAINAGIHHALIITAIHHQPGEKASHIVPTIITDSNCQNNTVRLAGLFFSGGS